MTPTRTMMDRGSRGFLDTSRRALWQTGEIPTKKSRSDGGGGDAFKRIKLATPRDADDDDAYMFRILLQGHDQTYTPVIIEVETGAKPATISLETYKKQFSKIRLRKTNDTYRSYDGSRVKEIFGHFTTNVMANGRIHRGTTHVVKEGIPAVLRNFLGPLKIQIDCAAGAVHTL